MGTHRARICFLANFDSIYAIRISRYSPRKNELYRFSNSFFGDSFDHGANSELLAQLFTSDDNVLPLHYNTNNMTLTANQKEFFLKTFFMIPDLPGWINIATKLLETGNCIVAGTDCIWKGGIGNFIKTTPAEGAVDCSNYAFDLENFMTSEYFKAIAKEFVEDLREKKNEADKKYSELQDLLWVKS